MQARTLSENPNAVRQRRFREKRRAGLVAPRLVTASGGEQVEVFASPGAAGAPARASSTVGGPTVGGQTTAPLHETRPVDGPGPEAFAAVPMLPPVEAGAKSEPFAVPAPPPPPPPTSPEEAEALAKGMAKLFEAGAMLALLKNHQTLSAFVNVGEVAAAIPKLKKLVEASASRVAVKYNVRVPYQDEAVCVLALGVAAYGFAAKVPANDAAPHAPPPPTEARRASEARKPPTPPPGPGAPPSGDAAPPTPWLPADE